MHHWFDHPFDPDGGNKGRKGFGDGTVSVGGYPAGSTLGEHFPGVVFRVVPRITDARGDILLKQDDAYRLVMQDAGAKNGGYVWQEKS